MKSIGTRRPGDHQLVPAKVRLDRERSRLAAPSRQAARTAEKKAAASKSRDGAAAKALKLPDAATCRELLETMSLIRRFEEAAGQQYMKAKVGGFLHLCIGEEATVVGATSVMQQQDYLISTYREHGQALARGTDPKAVMAELFGRVDGCSKGRGGSMHLFDGERRFMGGYGIVGGSLPLAAGFGLKSDYLGEDAATVCMFGDGASNQGNFGETMNLAALWNLPVVFLVINNQYGMGTAIERHSAVVELSRKAEGMGVPGERVDGMDILAVRECVAEHLRQAREDRQPTLVESLTYRFRGHSQADPEEYRTKEEVEEWRQRDPIATFAQRLVSDKVMTQEDVDAIDEAAKETVAESVAFADSSPEPPLESLYDNVYALGGEIQGWYTVDERTPDVHRGEDEHEVGASGTARQLAEAGAAYAGPAGPGPADKAGSDESDESDEEGES
jgi:pyruvate dehydrogenase E1 component alpha subunit